MAASGAGKTGLAGFGGGFSAGGVTAIGGAISDFFAADALRTKAKGSRIEAEQYGLAAGLADMNAQYTETSTAIKEYQLERSATKTLGEQAADVAASGFQASGSSVDILRDSVAQASLTKAVISQQGLIDEAGYREQAASFRLMQDASLMAAKADEHAATGATWTAAIKGAAAIASFL